MNLEKQLQGVDIEANADSNKTKPKPSTQLCQKKTNGKLLCCSNKFCRIFCYVLFIALICIVLMLSVCALHYRDRFRSCKKKSNQLSSIEKGKEASLYAYTGRFSDLLRNGDIQDADDALMLNKRKQHSEKMWEKLAFELNKCVKKESGLKDDVEIDEHCLRKMMNQLVQIRRYGGKQENNQAGTNDKVDHTNGSPDGQSGIINQAEDNDDTDRELELKKSPLHIKSNGNKEQKKKQKEKQKSPLHIKSNRNKEQKKKQKEKQKSPLHIKSNGNKEQKKKQKEKQKSPLHIKSNGNKEQKKKQKEKQKSPLHIKSNRNKEQKKQQKEKQKSPLRIKSNRNKEQKKQQKEKQKSPPHIKSNRNKEQRKKQKEEQNKN